MAVFVLPDPYKDMSLAQVKQRCRHLARVCARQDMMILAMSEVPGAMEALDPDDREKVKLLRLAYED